ncbi:MAG: PadR family transcriptional regulator [Gorillibacterium sp.]|nr:PadR family transcriptional regulator [Gorillibacterium sp.]
MNIQDVILGLLSKRSFSGYDIKHHFEEYFSFFFDASFGTIYPTLSKMEGLKLISKESIRQEGKPDKNIYTITPAGSEQFNRYLHAPADKEIFRSDFFMHLYFGDMADAATMETLLRQAMQEKQEMYDDLEQKLNQLDAFLPPYQKLSMELGLAQYAAFIQKVKSVLDPS